MTLTQARRYAVRHRTQIEFTSARGGACLIDEHGVARVPALAGAPEFSFTEEFGQAEQFVLTRSGQRSTVTREALAEMAGPATGAAHHDEDE